MERFSTTKYFPKALVIQADMRLNMSTHTSKLLSTQRQVNDLRRQETIQICEWLQRDIFPDCVAVAFCEVTIETNRTTGEGIGSLHVLQPALFSVERCGKSAAQRGSRQDEGLPSIQ